MNHIDVMKQALDALWNFTSKLESQLFRNPVVIPDSYRDIVRAGYASHEALATAIAAAEKAEQLSEGLRPLAESCKQTKFRRDIKTAVDRFLCWRLPEDFGPDCYVSFDREKATENRSWPIGTNLLTADQAKKMFEHCLEGTGYVSYAAAEKVEPDCIPVALIYVKDQDEMCHGRYISWVTNPVEFPHGTMLYTAPPAAIPGWQPTDEELTAIYMKANGIEGKNPPITTQRIFAAMRAMLAAAPKPPQTDDVVRDAERYRWLREQNADLTDDSFLVLSHDQECEHCDGAWVGSDLDAAIDEAMKG